MRFSLRRLMLPACLACAGACAAAAPRPSQHAAVHAVQTDSALVAGYIAYSEWLLGPAKTESELDNQSPELLAAEKAFYATEDVLQNGPPAHAWELTRAVLRAAPDERLDVYAAGILEDLVRQWGPQLVGEIEREATSDERFKWALGEIWLSVADLPPDALSRVVAASGGAIHPFPADSTPALRWPAADKPAPPPAPPES